MVPEVPDEVPELPERPEKSVDTGHTDRLGHENWDRLIDVWVGKLSNDHAFAPQSRFCSLVGYHVFIG